jgi:hypothetical protein
MSSRFTKRISDLEKFINEIPCIHPETYYPHANRIVAIGDIHGDFESLLRLLIGVKIINEQGIWIAGDTTFVQTGDIVDDSRYNFKRQKHMNNFEHLPEDELYIYAFLADLNLQAKAVGGKVLICMGNHEYTHLIIEMSNEDYYTQPATNDWYNKFGLDTRLRIFKPGGILAKKLSCMINLAVVIGDWIFCHGGINCSCIFSRADLEDINRKMKMYMNNGLLDLPYEDQLDYKHRFYDNEFILMDRRYSINQEEQDDSDACKEFHHIKNILDMPNAKIVVAHTIQDIPNSICNNSVFRIDTGLSRAFGPKENEKERLYALYILNNKPHIVNGDGLVFKVPNNDEYIEFLKSENKRIYEYRKQPDLVCRREDIPEIIYEDMDI